MNYMGFLLFLSVSVHAQASGILQTKTQLKELETKIQNLQHILHTANDKNTKLNQQLAYTEKEISVSVQKLRTTQLEASSKQTQIATLQNEINTLHEQLHNQQYLLAKHLRGRYMMGNSLPIKWFFNQENPDESNRVLTLYHYIVQSRQRMISQIQLTEKQLSLNEKELSQKYNEKQKLQQQLFQHQKKLEQNKKDSEVIIQGLTQTIQNNKQALTESLQNKNNLSKLISTLTQESLIKTQRPLLYKNKKLISPVNTKKNNIKKLNQGVVFFIDEGTPVIAVYPGKVVFSDWLKGYGLLLIIDHGQGFMTLYAHNQSLFKQKGDAVAQGVQIASVGHSGGLKKNGLYFEIRQRGKAIPPLNWL